MLSQVLFIQQLLTWQTTVTNLWSRKRRWDLALPYSIPGIGSILPNTEGSFQHTEAWVGIAISFNNYLSSTWTRHCLLNVTPYHQKMKTRTPSYFHSTFQVPVRTKNWLLILLEKNILRILLAKFSLERRIDYWYCWIKTSQELRLPTCSPRANDKEPTSSNGASNKYATTVIACLKKLVAP